ncbi:MAG TPA: hypothetical protein PK523_04170 [Elusimicrobiales bacterium]|nr:hypothetical protein [Elusimicrobiales bacterium]
MKKTLNCLLCFSLLAPSLAGCSPAARSARRAPLHPSVEGMLDEASRRTSTSGVAAAARDGIRQLRRGRYAAAGKEFAAGLRADPVNADLHFLNALAYHLDSRSGDLGKLDLAEAGYTLALRFDPDNHWASFFLGHVYFSQKRYKDAQNQFSGALLYSPGDPEFLRALAVASYYARDVRTGAWAAEKAAAADPESRSGWRIAALTRAAGGDLNGAEEAFLRYEGLAGEAGSGGEILKWNEERLRARLDDWRTFHAANPAIKPAGVFGRGSQPEGRPLDLGDDGENYDESMPAAPAASGEDGQPAPADDPNAPKMALIDVVILSTEESRSQYKGVNILSGLKATLTGTLFQYKWATGGSIMGQSGHGAAMSPTFALEGLEYNLNIWNDSVNKAEVLARPSLLAVENQTSQFYSGAVLHVQLNSNNSDGSLVDVPVGINLSVTPTFLDKDTVRVKVHADRSFIESRSEKLGFSAFSQTTKTSVDSTAILKFGETLILSGLTENETAVSKSGVPLLQSIPIVQWFFSNKTKEETKKSVLILLSPHKARRAAEHMTPRELREMKRAERLGNQAADKLKALRRKEGLTGKDNLDAVFEIMDGGRYYREFRTGDLQLDEWHNSDSLFGSLKRALGFLWY